MDRKHEKLYLDILSQSQGNAALVLPEVLAERNGLSGAIEADHQLNDLLRAGLLTAWQDTPTGTWMQATDVLAIRNDEPEDLPAPVHCMLSADGQEVKRLNTTNPPRELNKALRNNQREQTLRLHVLPNEWRQGGNEITWAHPNVVKLYRQAHGQSRRKLKDKRIEEAGRVLWWYVPKVEEMPAQFGERWMEMPTLQRAGAQGVAWHRR
jgi:hypothetical protein